MMRKVFVGLLVGAVAVVLAAPAFAADLKFTGSYRVRFQFDENLPCALDADAPGGEDCSGHVFQSRFRPRFEVETEGGVRGLLLLEIGDVRFGNSTVSGRGAGGGAGADAVNVETKNAYIDFPVPATPLRLRAGVQPLFLSKALFFDDDVSGISLYGKVGEINVNAFWARINNESAAASATAATSGSFGGQLQALIPDFEGTAAGGEGEHARDIYGLDLSFSPTKDLNLNVYVVYDHDMEFLTTGGKPTTGFWFGAAAAGKVQNIRWDLDFVYGTKEHNVLLLDADTGFGADIDIKDQTGWGVDGGVGMAVAGTPLDLELRGWYFSGWEGNLTGDIDAFPVLYGGSGGHEPGTQVWGGGGAIDVDALADNPQNTWAIGLIARYTVSPTLKITGNVHYIGTVEEGRVDPILGPIPSPAGDGFLFGVDSVGTEVGVKVDYTIAKGLVFTLTGGFLAIGDDLSIDGTTRFDDITKVAGVLNYGF